MSEPGRRTRVRPGVALVAFGLGLAGCGGEADLGPPGPPPPRPPPAGEPRAYRVGWAPSAPRPDETLFLQVVDSMAAVSDVTIIQQPVPWPELLAGAPMDSLVEDRGGVADFLRAKELDIVFLVDPLDGLDRRKEDPALVAAGRSILEPEIRETHEEWVRRIASRVRPEWLGLASEINTLGTLGDPALYAELVDLVNTLAPQARQRSPGSRVFVSFQADEALGLFPGIPAAGELATIDDFDVDALGLSSYPVFLFETPAAMPDDYFGPFREATDLPLIMVEGGWSSADTPALDGTPAEQVAFFERYEEYLDAVDARLWVMLTFTDLDIGALGLPPDRAASLSNFASMGILDVELRRKPAYATWARIHSRPLAP